ncbi:MAG: hypothetical protein AAF567_07860 [Actinomycetota bacterium]
MFRSFFRILKPVRLIKRRAITRGLFGGDRTWLVLGGLVWIGGRIRALFGFGEPQPVYTHEIDSGSRFVLAHSDPPRRRRFRRR